MATIKRKTTTKKRASSPPARRRTTTPAATATRKRRAPVRRKKGMLNDMFNPVMAKAGFKSTASGAVGGALAVLADKVIPVEDQNMQGLVKLAGGFVLATVAGLPNVGAGMAGAAIYQLAYANGFMNDDSNIDYADDLDQLPVALNDDYGYLQDASDYYLADGYDYLQDDEDYYNPGFNYSQMMQYP